MTTISSLQNTTSGTGFAVGQKPPRWPTLDQMVAARAKELGCQTAIIAPKRSPLSFSRLQEQIQIIRGRLWELGIGRDDIVASVLSNGPDAASALLCVSSCATLAALNPDLQQAEYESLFRRLAPKIILAYPDQAQPARKAALAASVAVIDVEMEAEAGVFSLRGVSSIRNSNRSRQPAGSEDIACIITTSGSAALPKLVPLRHRVLCSCISSVVDALALTPADRSLTFSPMFHLLGFNTGVLVPIGAGSSAVCAHGFQIDDFFRWIEEYQPTYFAAVPAILREILEHSSRHAAVLERSRIRFIRTGGSPLPSAVAAEIEAAFRAPLLQTYAQSECPSIASDRFGGVRRHGSCGHPICNEVVIVDGDGTPVAPGATGEVIVRGPAVIDEYFGDPALTRAAFHDGWFHTGDIGHLDADDYLFLTGRASEFINRGGEKISPAEVDQVLMAHPAVAEAVTFSMPHDKLGEDVAAAVVLRDDASTTEAQLQEFAAARLATHKLPRTIHFLKAIPVGPTGKIQRSKMRDYLAPHVGHLNGKLSLQVEPRDERERRISALFSQVLHRERVGIHESFFDLGGDSLAATECARLLGEELGCSNISPAVFLWAQTVAQLAELVLDPRRLEHRSDVIPIQPRGDGIPLFLIQPGFEANRLARHLGRNRPLYGIPISPSDAGARRSIPKLAAECAQALRRFQPEGPYALTGWCAGGVIALELARLLNQQGSQVAFVAMLDVRNFFLPPLRAPHLAWVRWWRRIRRLSYVTWRWPAGFWSRFRQRLESATPVELPDTTQAMLRHRPQPWSGRMVHIWAADWLHGRYFDPGFGWNHLAPAGFVFHEVPGDHLTMLQEPNVAAVARILVGELDRARRTSGDPRGDTPIKQS